MKRIALIALIAFTVASCNRSTKLLRSGNFDEAISVSAKKLKRNKTKEKEIKVLEQAYKQANESDNNRVLYLKKEGTPENWKSIYSLYSKMKNRQDQVKPLLPLYIKKENREAVFEFSNYDDDIVNSKKNAAEYSYNIALNLLKSGNKSDARKAYYEFLKTKELFSNFKDVDAQIQNARNAGISYALFKMKNETGVPLPPNFEEDLCKISLTDLESEWIHFHTAKQTNYTYDYTILVNMKNINVSPESVKEINYTETKTVPDGFEYLLDNRGNVKKDSAGNDIKIPKTKIISCGVQEVYQSKKAMIAGTLDFINNGNNQLLKTDPIASENFFEYASAIAIGDLNALKPETKAKIGRKPVPFPNNFDMIFQSGQTLKGMVKNIIVCNKNVLY